MNKFLDKMEEKMLPMVEAVQSNKYLSAIQYGMMAMMPLMMVGAFCVLSVISLLKHIRHLWLVFSEKNYGQTGTGAI